MLLSTFDGGGFLTVSPDAHTLAVIGKQITLWNIADPTRPARTATLPDFTIHAGGMAFSPDSRTGPSRPRHCPYYVTDPGDPATYPIPRPPANDSNHDAGPSWFSPDGRLLAVKAGETDQATLWNVADRGAPRSLATIAFGPDEPPFGEIAFGPSAPPWPPGPYIGHLTLWNITDPANPMSPPLWTILLSANMYVPTVGIALALQPRRPHPDQHHRSIQSTWWDVTDRTAAAASASRPAPTPAPATSDSP